MLLAHTFTLPVHFQTLLYGKRRETGLAFSLIINDVHNTNYMPSFQPGTQGLLGRGTIAFALKEHATQLGKQWTHKQSENKTNRPMETQESKDVL